MRLHPCRVLVLAAMVLLAHTQSGFSQEPRALTEDESAIVKNAAAFVDAFEKGDAEAVASFWVADGDYTDQTGRHLKGRDAIAKTFSDLFAANKGLKLRIDSEALRFVTPDVAIEDGITSVLTPDGAPPSRVRYSIVHVKKDGKWQLSSVRDAAYAPPSNSGKLASLEWIVGDWAQESEKGNVARASFAWTENQNFIVGSFTTTFKDIELEKNTEWIGWDPKAKRVRSWTFGSGGGFGESFWTQDGDNWLVSTGFMLPDGKTVQATANVKIVDADTIIWQPQTRTLDGEALPKGEEIKLKRAK